MSANDPWVLIIGTADAERRMLSRFAKKFRFRVESAESFDDARKWIADQPTIVVIDLAIDTKRGLEWVQELDDADTEVLVTSESPSATTVVKAFRRGVMDFILKPFTEEQVQTYFERVSRAISLNREVYRLRGELRELGRFGKMIGRSEPMQEVYDMISKIAPTDAAVLIVGETGTGKELVADTLHHLSRRENDAFIPINSGAIQPALFESELFGHEKGAFTGANERHHGIFEQADGGTVFLDEITEMPIDIQVKLLRFLENKKFRRVGSTKPIKSDVRIIAATNRDPQQAIADGQLREDVYYRLATFSIRVPPLRQRGDDLHLLADHFLQQNNQINQTHKSLSNELKKNLSAHDWPGNVRELRNSIQRAYVLADDEVAETPSSGLSMMSSKAAGPDKADGVGVVVGDSIADAERRLILATLESKGGDKKATAKVLGISLKTLYTRLKVYRG